MKHWKYKNESEHRTVIWRDISWKPGETQTVAYPLPEYLGLTCVEEGTRPDPILCHEDVVLQAGESARIEIAAPLPSEKVSLTLTRVKGGAECRFNNEKNRPIPVDGRPFSRVLPWEYCAVLFFNNMIDDETHISVDAVAQ